MRQSFLHFVDLAGCERVKRTGNSGARLRESVAINSSLMTLSRCLEVLRYNQQHLGDQKVIPYRESKVRWHLSARALRASAVLCSSYCTTCFACRYSLRSVGMIHASGVICCVRHTALIIPGVCVSESQSCSSQLAEHTAMQGLPHGCGM